MTDAAVETAYLAWLAEQMIPAEELSSVIREYRTGEAWFLHQIRLSSTG